MNMQINIGGIESLFFICSTLFALHIVVTIAKHAYDRVLKRVLKLSTNVSTANIFGEI